MHTSNPQTVRVLMVDDSRVDFEVVARVLQRISPARHTLTRAATYEEGLAAVESGEYDACLLDFHLGGRTGLDMLRMLNERGRRIPVILLTGLDQPTIDNEALELGAEDFLPKGELAPALLERTIRYAIRHRQLINDLEDALTQVRLLEGILPICSYCRKIRDDKDYWQGLEAYLSRHAVRFTHGICPDCYVNVAEPQIEQLRAERLAGEGSEIGPNPPGQV